MYYEEIRKTAPVGLKKHRMPRVLNPAHVLFFFLFETILFLTLGFYLQMRFGDAGLIMTELGMLLISVLFVILMRADWRDVFPIRRPRAGAMWGSVVIWIGAILLAMIGNVILMFLFPDIYLSLYEAESEVGATMALPVQILVIAVLPAICEEALHRGVIQRGIEHSVRNRWAVAAIMGAVFSVFHIYPIRYLNMFILGAVISLVMAETGNMIYSSFIHFLNNAFSVLIGTLAPGMVYLPRIAESILGPEAELELFSFLTSVRYLGLTMIFYGVPAPILLYVGHYLIRCSTAPQRPYFLPPAHRRSMLLRILVPTIGFFVIGLILFVVG